VRPDSRAGSAGLPVGCGALSSGTVTSCFNTATRTLQHFTRVTTIDALNVPRLALLKLDLEGGELDALRGANRTLHRWRPLVYAEEHAAKPRESSVVHLLWALNYTVFYHRFRALSCLPEGEGKPLFAACKTPYWERNVLGVPSERLEELRARAPVLQNMSVLHDIPAWALMR